MRQAERPTAGLSGRLETAAASYIDVRLRRRPELDIVLAAGSLLLAGHQAQGLWDERSSLDLRLVVEDAAFARIAAELKEEWRTPAGPAGCFLIDDPNPFRTFPGARVVVLSISRLQAELAEEPVVALWAWRGAALLQDPEDRVATILAAASERFAADLAVIRCRHYFRFRRARQHLDRFVRSRAQGTDLAVQRGESIREALRLAFLVEGQPYPADPWLELLAEEQTSAGPAIVTAVRGLAAAEEAETIERSSKVLRDRVVQALQRAGITEPWLEWWWAWPGWSTE